MERNTNFYNKLRQALFPLPHVPIVYVIGTKYKEHIAETGVCNHLLSYYLDLAR
jgi:2-keto-4-pentenoate hydratase/2-oxohepta-3-ene-1,7-dioic acid hydratase in catechol pathway